MATHSRTERSREAILSAADAAFSELGFDGASMDGIAKRAGLTRKTLYNLFASKEDIALRLIYRVEANNGLYRARMAAKEDALTLLNVVLIDSARWCLANPALARLVLAPADRPHLEPPSDRPSFQGLVRDLVVLGQAQGIIRRDEDANFMSLVLLGVHGQAMLSALARGDFSEGEVARLIKIVVEGIGERQR